MSRVRLSDAVITARMVELRNLRRLHARDRAQIDALKADNKALRAEITELRQLLAEAHAHIQTQAIQIAELQTMVFGKKKRPPAGTKVPALPTEPLPLRNAASYRRPLPPAHAVTKEVVVPLPKTCTCGGSFGPDMVTRHDRYEEDNLQAAIHACKVGGWSVKVGDDCFNYIREKSGFDLKAYLVSQAGAHPVIRP